VSISCDLTHSQVS